MLKSYHAIILDCDGVIFDSNGLKLEAFAETLACYDPELVKRFLSYVRRSFGMSRYRLFRCFVGDYLEVKDEELFDSLIEKFGIKCLSLYQNAQLTDGCQEFLEKYSGRVPLFVASGSDEDELRAVFKTRSLDVHFQEIRGSPKPKMEIVSDIRAKMGDFELVMIGDALSDFRAAKENGVDFFFMRAYSTNSIEMTKLASDEGFQIVEKLSDLI